CPDRPGRARGRAGPPVRRAPTAGRGRGADRRRGACNGPGDRIHLPGHALGEGPHRCAQRDAAAGPRSSRRPTGARRVPPALRGPLPGVPVFHLERLAQPAPGAHGALGAAGSGHRRDGTSRDGLRGPPRLQRRRRGGSAAGPDRASAPGSARRVAGHDRRASRRVPAGHGSPDRGGPARGREGPARSLGRAGAAQRRATGTARVGGAGERALPPARGAGAAERTKRDTTGNRTRGLMNDKTYTARQGEIERSWFVVDAAGETLGRLATRVARVLEGKHKPTWSPNLDGGDHVIVLNARKISVSAAKLETKSYVRHSGHPQGLKEESLGKLLERRPEEVVRRAIKGMLPHTRLGAQQLRKLKIYAGSDHPHQAQRPEPLA